jgi:subtilisin family serine protease
VTGAADLKRLQELRLMRVRELLRKHRDVIEADPRGAPILRSEVLAFSPSSAAIDAARADGFNIVREKNLEGLGARVVVLRAPQGMSTRSALKRLRKRDPTGSYDFNHVYTESGMVSDTVPVPPATATPPPPPVEPTYRVGLIDGGIDTAHPVFASARVRLFGCDGRRVPSAHGTAVASLIVGEGPEFHGAAPRAQLFAADVYCGVPTGGAADAVVESLAWMARERVAVVNMSLVGPPNAMLEQVIRALLARGHLVVAAIGNDGPAAPPLYPAAYPGVVGVTGVDARQRALLEAGRGPHVDFAAPGADMVAASHTSVYAEVRGTSFAAPIVAGLLATQLKDVDSAAGTRAIAGLAAQAIDLGPRGRDKTYGDGLVGTSLRAPLSLAGAQPKK